MGSLAGELRAHAATFRERFSRGAPEHLFFSPGRVNLFGAHLDYNGGPVMPTAVDVGTFLAVARRPDRSLRLHSTLAEDAFECDLSLLSPDRRDEWVDYPIGVLLEIFHQANLVERPDLPGLDILYGGNLPVGAGLSSSASICVGTAHALNRVWELDLAPMTLVQCALNAEREHVGVHCGIMDPYAVGLARPNHILWLDCKDASWEHLPLSFDQLSIAVADSGVRRRLAQGNFNLRVEECGLAFRGLREFAPDAECLRDVSAEVLAEYGHELSPPVRRRAQHVIHEVGRTFEARRALTAGDVKRMGALMAETQVSLRECFEVSTPELDCLVDASIAAGGFGGRLTGAGFGGCVVLLLPRGDEERVCAGVRETFHTAFGRTPNIALYGGDRGPRELNSDGSERDEEPGS